MALIVGLRFLPQLRKRKLDLLLLILAFYFCIHILIGWYSFNKWHNLHIHNTCRLVGVALYLILFFRMLNLGKRERDIFKGFAILILTISVVEYVMNFDATSHANFVTIVLLNFQNILLSGWLVARRVTDPQVRRIYLEPYFFLFAGFLIDGLIHTATHAIHAYVVADPSVVPRFLNVYLLYFFSASFWGACVILSFLLIARESCVAKSKSNESNNSRPLRYYGIGIPQPGNSPR